VRCDPFLGISFLNATIWWSGTVTLLFVEFFVGSCTVFKQEDAADDVKMTADGDGDSRDPVTPDDDSHLAPADGAASGTVEQKPVEAGALGLVKLEGDGSKPEFLPMEITPFRPSTGCEVKEIQDY